MINRLIVHKLDKLWQQFPVVAVMGPRQAGKTTLLRHLFSNLKYTSLEDLDKQAYAQQDPRAFIKAHAGGAILDEVQRVPELFSYLQTTVDEVNQPGQFILSGSQNFLLLEKISQSLAGRVALLSLLPLSVAELNAAQQLPETLDTVLFQGSYPRLYDQQIAPSDWYSNYIRTYVERDVRTIINITALSTFQKFLKLCAGRNGQVLNLTALGDECGISHNTANAWISLLEASFVVFRLQPYYKNFNKRIVKMPKLYFFDTGLVCSLLGIQNAMQLSTHYLRGNIFESFIISEIYKWHFNQGISPTMYFWRDQQGHEVDCIVEQGEYVHAIEIKSGQTVTNDFFKGLQYWDKITDELPKKHRQLIYGGYEKQIRSNIQIYGWQQVEDLFMQP